MALAGRCPECWVIQEWCECKTALAILELDDNPLANRPRAHRSDNGRATAQRAYYARHRVRLAAEARAKYHSRKMSK